MKTMERQATVAQPIQLKGIGLHSGKTVELELLPAGVNSGIWFQRTDHAGAQPVAAHYSNVSSTDLSTSIGSGGNKVSTIEHLMAAFAGLGIDNVMVRVSGEELPILDGSSAPFVAAIRTAGIRKLDGYKKQFIVREAFELRSGDRYIRVEPASRQRFSCIIEFGSSVIGRQTCEYQSSRTAFTRLCEARTFCHVNEVDAMRKVGLALGGSLENAVVVSDSEVVNAEGLRSHDEFVRHKLLDAIGDLALLGGELVGKITLHKAGHGLHAQFMNELMKRRSECLSVVESAEFGATTSEVQDFAAANLTQVFG